MEPITEQKFREIYKLAVPSDFKLNQKFFRMVPSGDGFVAEEVKLTGNLAKDAIRFNDMTSRSQAFLATTKAPKKLQSTKKTPAYVAPKTSELTSPLNAPADLTRKGLKERSDKIKKGFAKKK